MSKADWWMLVVLNTALWGAFMVLHDFWWAGWSVLMIIICYSQATKS